MMFKLSHPKNGIGNCTVSIDRRISTPYQFYLHQTVHVARAHTYWQYTPATGVINFWGPRVPIFIMNLGTPIEIRCSW
jgi:hypothetical protein